MDQFLLSPACEKHGALLGNYRKPVTGNARSGGLSNGVCLVPPTILVVDDHLETRTLIVRILQPQGYEVAAVADGEAALAMAAIKNPDLVIADVLLPGLNGLSVIDTLRQRDARLRVIAISAVHDVLEHPESVPAGLDPESIAFLPKPFALTSLIALVHQLLRDPVLIQTA